MAWSIVSTGLDYNIDYGNLTFSSPVVSVNNVNATGSALYDLWNQTSAYGGIMERRFRGIDFTSPSPTPISRTGAYMAIRTPVQPAPPNSGDFIFTSPQYPNGTMLTVGNGNPIGPGNFGGISVNGASDFFNPQAPFSNAIRATNSPAAPSVSTSTLRLVSSTPGSTAYHAAFYVANGSTGHIWSPAGGNVAYASGSDYRLKDNITPLDGNDSLEKIKSLKPRHWTWKENGDPSVGFVAHEVQEVYPEASEYGIVSGYKDQEEVKGYYVYSANNSYVDTYTKYDEEGVPTVHPSLVDEPTQEELDAAAAEGKSWVESERSPIYQSVDQSFLVSPLISAVQALSDKVDALEARVAALEAA